MPSPDVTAVRVVQGGGQDGSVHRYAVQAADERAADAIALAEEFGPDATRPMPSDPVCCDQALYGVTIEYADGHEVELGSWSADDSPVHDLAAAVIIAADA